METLTLYRRRLIPDENILLKDDHILSYDGHILVTSWNTLHPKKDLHHGYSVYYLDRGIKVSKFLREDGSLINWYCDITDHEFSDEDSVLTVIDLLADVIVEPTGLVRVVDLDELVEARRKEMITEETLLSVLERVNTLVQAIYHDEFSEWTAPIDLLAENK